MDKIIYHPEADLMRVKLDETRTALAGEFFVKKEREHLLPHPSSVDKTSSDARIRYEIYLANAEYDNYPAQTKESLTGRMKFDAADILLPERIAYLEQSADGDGLSLRGAMQQTAGEVLAVKWQCLVADYRGLSDAELETVSLADIQLANPRATIKAYSRENVVNWHFERVNGAMQLVYVMLREVGWRFASESGLRIMVESFLILALDENGNYYQQKVVRNADKGFNVGEMSFVTVGGQPMKWLPVLFASDKELPSGKLPLELGYLSPICDLALARYRMSAEYKETIRNLPPTTYIKGATTNDWDSFTQANGRDFIMTGSGSTNILFGSMEVDVVGAESTVAPYEQYFERNTEQARQLGAVIQGDVSASTATEASITASEQNARLVTLAGSIEAVYKRMCLYCGMFEGLWAPDAIEQNMGAVTITLSREFARGKLSAQDRDAIRNDYLAGLIDRTEALLQMQAGGVLQQDAEALLDAADGGE